MRGNAERKGTEWAREYNWTYGFEWHKWDCEKPANKQRQPEQFVPCLIITEDGEMHIGDWMHPVWHSRQCEGIVRVKGWTYIPEHFIRQIDDYIRAKEQSKPKFRAIRRVRDAVARKIHGAL